MWQVNDIELKFNIYSYTLRDDPPRYFNLPLPLQVTVRSDCRRKDVKLNQ
jgi:hypothetical protein